MQDAIRGMTLRESPDWKFQTICISHVTIGVILSIYESQPRATSSDNINPCAQSLQVDNGCI